MTAPGGGAASASARILDRIPTPVGFGLILLAGALLVVIGLVLPDAGAVAFGVATVASATIAWTSGARSQPRVDPLKRRFGGTVTRIARVPWLIIFGLYLAALVIALVT